MSAETIAQGAHLAIVLLVAFILYRAAREDYLPRARAKWLFFLLGMFFVGLGLVIGIRPERTVTNLLLLKHLGFGTDAICLGYSFLILWVSCFVPKGNWVR
jgi:hypothetical protein